MTFVHKQRAVCGQVSTQDPISFFCKLQWDWTTAVVDIDNKVGLAHPTGNPD